LSAQWCYKRVLLHSIFFVLLLLAFFVRQLAMDADSDFVLTISSDVYRWNTGIVSKWIKIIKRCRWKDVPTSGRQESTYSDI